MLENLLVEPHGRIPASFQAAQGEAFQLWQVVAVILAIGFLPDARQVGANRGLFSF